MIIILIASKESIDAKKLSMSNGAVKLALDESGRYNEYNKGLYSIINLNQIPREVFCLTFGIAESANKKFNGSLGYFFRVYDGKDDFEILSFDVRRKGFHSSIEKIGQ